MVTVQDVVDFLREYSAGWLMVLAVAAALFLRVRAASVKAYVRWASEVKHVAVAAVVIIAAIVASALAAHIYPNNPEVPIRHTGLALVLLGTATVIWGILKTRSDFQLPTLRSKAKEWVKRCPWLQQSGNLQLPSASITMIFDSADAYGIHGVGDNPTMEAVVDALMKNVKALHQRIDSLKHDTDEKIREVSRSVAYEEQARKKDADDIRRELLATATGGLHISAIGASWLIVGSILGTAAPELAAILR